MTYSYKLDRDGSLVDSTTRKSLYDGTLGFFSKYISKLNDDLDAKTEAGDLTKREAADIRACCCFLTLGIAIEATCGLTTKPKRRRVNLTTQKLIDARRKIGDLKAKHRNNTATSTLQSMFFKASRLANQKNNSRNAIELCEHFKKNNSSRLWKGVKLTQKLLAQRTAPNSDIAPISDFVHFFKKNMNHDPEKEATYDGINKAWMDTCINDHANDLVEDGIWEVMNTPLSMCDIDRATRQMGNNKAPGPDGILSEMITKTGDGGRTFFYKFLDGLWSSEITPKLLTTGIISPIFKGKAGDRGTPDSYRPITLTSILGKLFERIIYNRLMDFLEANNLLAAEQHGFRPRYSTIDAVFALEQKIQAAGKNIPVFAAFLDIKKAYDSVWREGLWYLMHQKNIRGKIWRVIRNSYDSVQSCVRINGQTSDMFDVLLGLRQGSVISPILYSIFIEQVVHDLKQKHIEADTLMFADDICIMTTDPQQLQDALDCAANTVAKWRFDFSTTKSQIVVFNDKSWAAPEPEDNDEEKEEKCEGKKEKEQWKPRKIWKINKKEIAQVPMFKYLGIILRQDGMRDSEIQDVVDNVHTEIAILNRTGWLGEHVPISIRKHIVDATILPLLMYGAELFPLASTFLPKEQWKKLDKLWAYCAKRVLRVPSRCSCRVALAELGWWRISTFRDEAILRYKVRLDGKRDTCPVIINYKLAKRHAREARARHRIRENTQKRTRDHREKYGTSGLPPNY